MSNEDRSSIGDDGLRDTVIADDVGYVELGILSDPICRGYGYEVGRLSQAVHDDPYRAREVRGKLTMKSMQIFSHFHSRTLKGCRFLAGLK
jgi:hypothetical protein